MSLHLSEWQIPDPDTGTLMPYYTHPFLKEVLKNWSLKDKRVFEFGGGASTIWWAENAKEVYTAESDMSFCLRIENELEQRKLLNAHVFHKKVVAGEVELKSDYVQSIYQVEGEFDILIVDGSYRDECVAAALTKIKDGGAIICDNWDQDGIWDSIMAGRLLDGFACEIFVQPDHTDHQGRPWKTGYWRIHKGPESYKHEGYTVAPDNLLIVTDDYNSHRPMLWMACEHIKPANPGERGDVVELGCGYGSTPLLGRYCEMQKRLFVSMEMDPEWSSHFKNTLCVSGSWMEVAYTIPTDALDILFIDCKPGEDRKDLITYFWDKAKVVVVHDTELSAEYVYHMEDALNSYNYRCDLVIEGHPQTTAVSNVYDFSRWKGLTFGKYKFI